jgi:SM-20-related protein
MSGAAAMATDLAERGWSCRDGFLPPECVTALRAQVQDVWMRGDYRAAAVGGGARRALRPAVRGDQIHWLTAPFPPALERLRAELEELRLGLNRELALGLFDLELHFARYAPGRGYERHLDQLAGSDARVLSWVLYLNEDWRVEEGGALRLYTPVDRDAPFVEFAPHAGRLMAFLSGRIEHEVLPATRERLSITGWFRRREKPWAM